MTSTLMAIAMKILGQLIGYNFVCKVIISFCELWAKSTKTDFDDRVFDAVSEALGVESQVLRRLVTQANEKLLNGE